MIVDVYVRAEIESQWHMIKVDVQKEFDVCRRNVASVLGLEQGSFQLSLVGGGIVERSAVLATGDKLVA